MSRYLVNISVRHLFTHSHCTAAAVLSLLLLLQVLSRFFHYPHLLFATFSFEGEFLVEVLDVDKGLLIVADVRKGSSRRLI